MPKLSKNTVNNERLRLYHLNRECVRRNPKYILQYQEATRPSATIWAKLGMISEWGLWSNDELPDPKERPDLDKLRELKASYPVSLPFDRTFDPEIDRAMSVFTSKLHSFSDEKSFKDLKGMMILVHFPEKTPANWEMTAIKTNWSKKDIVEFFTSLIDSILRKRREQGLTQEKAGSRLRIKNDFDYLKVYDLRESGKSFREVAEIMWPGSQFEAVDSERKARLYYKKAKELINEPPIWRSLEENYKARQQKMNEPIMGVDQIETD